MLDFNAATPDGNEKIRRLIVSASVHEPGQSWPEPKPLVSTLPAVARLEPDMLPDAIRGYVLDVSARSQCPVDFVAVCALVGLASMLGNKIRIRPKQFDDWTIVPNLWGAIIGRPSAMKSPSMTAALAPVYALQDEARKNWEADCAARKIDAEVADIAKGAAKKKARRLAETGDLDQARDLIQGAGGDNDEDPPQPRFIINDATVEKLGELLNENPNGLTQVRDELAGWLGRMESEEHCTDRAFYLEAFNGDSPFTYDRIGRGTIQIAACTLSLIGGIQPSRLAPLVRGALTGAGNDGLIQRLQLAVWPDDSKDWTWIDRRPDEAARESYFLAFRHLHALAPVDLPASAEDMPTVMRFDEEAQGLFRKWMEEIQIRARAGGLPSVMESHILKMPKTVAALALLFELLDGGRVVVGKVATARALDWADYLESHARRVYAAGETMIEDGARLIWSRRKQLPDTFTARDIHQKAWAGLTDRETVGDILEMLTDLQWVGAERKTDSAGGRPTITYSWNPRLIGKEG